MPSSEDSRKRALLEEWEERERDDFRKTIKLKSLSVGLDLVGATPLVDLALDAVTRESQD